MNDQTPDVEQVIAGMRDEAIREIGRDTISAAAQYGTAPQSPKWDPER